VPRKINKTLLEERQKEEKREKRKEESDSIKKQRHTKLLYSNNKETKSRTKNIMYKKERPNHVPQTNRDSWTED